MAETRQWRNWAGDQVCEPTASHQPETVQEAADIVGTATEAGRHVKVAGSGHSFTSAAMTDGDHVHVGKLNRLHDADPPSGLVRVGGGIVLHELNEQLADLGLALPNLGDIDHQTVAGAIATATHGTGASLVNVSAQVKALELVTAAGDIIEVDGGDDLLAARVNIGALGAVTAVTLQCVPAFVLHRVDEPKPLDDVLGNFGTYAADNEHFEFFVFPGADTALTIRRNRTARPPAPRSRLDEFINEDLLQNRLGDLLLRLTRRAPRLIPAFSRLATRLLSEGEYIDASHRVFASRRDIHFTEMEYAVPFEQGPAAVRAVLKLIKNQGIPVAMPIECRVVNGDDALLSPTHKRPSTYVAVHQYRGMDWEPYFRAVEEIMLGLGGRPHWGKRHHLTAAQLRDRYPRFDDFLAIRDRLDPTRTFANDYTRQVLGD